jgi:hypothetical protein
MSEKDSEGNLVSYRVERFIQSVRTELNHAIKKWPPFTDKHEAYAHILEEMDELWDAIKNDEPMLDARKEAIQVAAMAIRFCVDVPEEHRSYDLEGKEK